MSRNECQHLSPNFRIQDTDFFLFCILPYSDWIRRFISSIPPEIIKKIGFLDDSIPPETIRKLGFWWFQGKRTNKYPYSIRICENREQEKLACASAPNSVFFSWKWAFFMYRSYSIIASLLCEFLHSLV